VARQRGRPLTRATSTTRLLCGSRAGYSTNKAAHDLLGAFALRGAPLGVGAGGGVDAQAGERDHPQRVVGLAVAAAVEPVADGLAGGGLDRADAAQGGKRGVGGQAVGGPRELQLSPELRHIQCDTTCRDAG
jgi:hypothetical protein